MSAIGRRVKGSLFVDYVRMLRSRRDVDWSKYLNAEDHGYLVQRVEPETWYPMETFERMGIAIFDEVARGDLEVVRMFGRVSIDWLCRSHENLVAHGDPRDSLMRFQVLRQTLFDYPAISIATITDADASIHIRYGMSAKAEEAASWQTLGFFERLLEVAGATKVKAWFGARSWNGDAVTAVSLAWQQPEEPGSTPTRPHRA